MGSATAWAVSNTGVRSVASDSGLLSGGGGAVWMGLAAAVVIASIPADAGAAVWLVALKFSRSCSEERLVAACGAAGPAGLPGIEGAAVSMLGLALGGEAEAVSDGASAISVAPRLGAVLGRVRAVAGGVELAGAELGCGEVLSVGRGSEFAVLLVERLGGGAEFSAAGLGCAPELSVAGLGCAVECSVREAERSLERFRGGAVLSAPGLGREEE